MATIGAARRCPARLPRKGASPKENTPPSSPASQYPWGPAAATPAMVPLAAWSAPVLAPSGESVVRPVVDEREARSVKVRSDEDDVEGAAGAEEARGAGAAGAAGAGAGAAEPDRPGTKAKISVTQMRPSGPASSAEPTTLYAPLMLARCWAEPRRALWASADEAPTATFSPTRVQLEYTEETAPPRFAVWNSEFWLIMARLWLAARLSSPPLLARGARPLPDRTLLIHPTPAPAQLGVAVTTTAPTVATVPRATAVGTRRLRDLVVGEG